MNLPTLDNLRDAARRVHEVMPSTPQYSWPLLNQWVGTELWLKHENHTPVGAFKVRGGLVYLQRLRERDAVVSKVIAATRGNHGQSIAFAAARAGMSATVVVPKGNSTEKNLAMQALGATVIEHGAEFHESRAHAIELAQQGWHMVPSFHEDLVAGVASYWLEMFEAQPALDMIYVPIGQGSGICAAIAARNALGLDTRIVGVVSSHALGYQLSYQRKEVVESPVSTVLADGLACRVPDAASLSPILNDVDDVVDVSDAEVAAAMRACFSATHNVAEGAGAAGLAAIRKHATRLKGLRVGTVLSGGNVDTRIYADVLSGTGAHLSDASASCQRHSGVAKQQDQTRLIA